MTPEAYLTALLPLTSMLDGPTWALLRGTRTTWYRFAEAAGALPRAAGARRFGTRARRRGEHAASHRPTA